MNEKAPRPLIFDVQTILAKYEQASKISQYLSLLEQENDKINLVSRETSRSDLERLAAESLFPFEVIKTKSFSNYLDIGSGGGFPAIPIILSINVKNATLIERTKKKTLALKRMSDQLGLKTQILDQNFKECQFNRNFDLITLRLVKPTNSLLNKVLKTMTDNGIIIYYSRIEEDTVKSKFTAMAYPYITNQDSPPKFFTIITN